MQKIRTPDGIAVSFEKHGSGPPLVLVHGAFSDHHTNWEFVLPALAEHFTVYAIARRGRGETDATTHHTVEQESRDAVALIETIDEPVFLLGHSYGAVLALLTASVVPDRISKLVLYEPAWPQIIGNSSLAALTIYAEASDWSGFSYWFFRNVVQVSEYELEAVLTSELWPPIVADAPASLEDLRALSKFEFIAERYGRLDVPTLLQVGSESNHDLYITDALADVLPDVRIDSLKGQAHEGMTTAPDQYVASMCAFLLAPEAVAAGTHA